MLFRLIDGLGQKKSKQVFKKFIERRAYLGLAAGLLFTLLALQLDLSSFALGFLLGMGVGLIAGSLLYLFKIRNDQALTKEYIAYYDERNQHLNRLAMTLVLVLTYLFISLMLVLYAFWSIELAYPIILIIIIYLLVLGGFLIRFILNKLL